MSYFNLFLLTLSKLLDFINERIRLSKKKAFDDDITKINNEPLDYFSDEYGNGVQYNPEEHGHLFSSEAPIAVDRITESAGDNLNDTRADKTSNLHSTD